jgi:hypothetical protein
MNFIMTPPVQEEFTKNDLKVDTVRVLDRSGYPSGLGQLPIASGGDQNSWVMPVVIIVVSAMALMTLYAVLNKR